MTKSSTSTRFTIRRDGDKDLTFNGLRLGSGSDHESNGSQDSRWSEIDIYRTDSGKYVVAQVYRTQWQGESESHHAEVCESAAEVLGLLELEEDEEGPGGISNMAKEALEAAAENDSAFAGLTTEAV